MGQAASIFRKDRFVKEFGSDILRQLDVQAGMDVKVQAVNVASRGEGGEIGIYLKLELPGGKTLSVEIDDDPIDLDAFDSEDLVASVAAAAGITPQLAEARLARADII